MSLIHHRPCPRVLRWTLLAGLAWTVVACTAATLPPASTVLNDVGTGEWGVTGTIVDAAGVGLPNLVVGLVSTTQTFATKTDKDGKYVFSKMLNGTYNVRPSQPGYGFVPEFRDISINGGDVTVDEFVGALSGGGGTDAGSHSDAGATEDGIATEDGGSSGFWTGSYSLSGWVYLRSVHTGKATTTALPGVKVTLTNGIESVSTYTEPGGPWRLASMIPEGTYTLRYEKAGWTMVPKEKVVKVGPGISHVMGETETMTHSNPTAFHDAADNDWTDPRIRVVDLAGKPLPFIGVVAVSDEYKSVAFASSKDNGWAAFARLLDGAYRAYPTEPGYTFTPPYIDFSFSAPDPEGETTFYTVSTAFTATKDSGAKNLLHTLKGRVVDSGGDGIAGASVAIGCINSMTNVKPAKTAADGTWTIADYMFVGSDPIVVHATHDKHTFAQPFAFVVPTESVVTVPDIQ